MLAFDTHQYIKHLMAVGVPAEQAEVHAEELKTIIQHDIATKQDVEWSKAELKKEIETTKAELKKEIEITKAELKYDIKELDAKIETTKAELKKEIELAKTELIGQIVLLRWLMGVVLGGIITLIVKSFFGA